MPTNSPDAATTHEVERVAGVDLVDQDGGSPTVRITRVASVGGRTFYSVRTDKDQFGFYVTRTGLIRGAR